VNGVLAIKGIQTTIPSKIIRKNNFIGQSNYVDKNINALYDDINIYEGATIPEQLIKSEYYDSVEASNDLAYNQDKVSYTNKAAQSIHHWDMSSLINSIDGPEYSFYGGENYSFVEDRFGKPHSAIYLNNGFLQIPPGVYIHGDYTIAVMVKFISFNYPFNYIWNFGNLIKNK
jgi:hypothetical protein